jgi:hypothetical protein
MKLGYSWVAQLPKNFPEIYETLRFVTVFTGARQLDESSQ